MNKALAVIGVLLGMLFLTWLWIEYTTASSKGPVERCPGSVGVRIDRGMKVREIADELERLCIIDHPVLFSYAVWKKGIRSQLIAGEYELSASMRIPEILEMLTNAERIADTVTITFPEGWTAQKMAERLTANKLPGEAFLQLVVQSPENAGKGFVEQGRDIPSGFSVIPDRTMNFEGFLFPDTYSFSKKATEYDILFIMLGNFERRWFAFGKDGEETSLRVLAEQSDKSVLEIVTMASIVEREVRTPEDRKMVADLFWRRLQNGMPLQSDATVQYASGENKVQHSFEETRVDSPYNTYVNKGLPPGPIGNPGMESLLAALRPTPNKYVYFLNDTQTGETIFSRTFEEHVRNKSEHGL
jgi:UPF0755 protein